MRAAKRPPFQRFSISHLVLIVPWIALVIDAWQPIRDNSFLWHVRAGEVQLMQGEVLTTDPFSFTMGGTEWRTQSWLVELLYAFGEDIADLAFVPPMLLIISALTFIGTGLIAYHYSESVPATAFVLVLSTVALISFLAPRPVLFSYLLLVLVVLAWARPTTRWTLPFLMWVWASVHASFLIGLGYIGLSLLMRKEWRALRIATVAGAVTLATAHGLGVVEFLITFGENRDALDYLTEWRKPELFSVVLLPFLGGLVFIVIGAFRQRISPNHLLLLVPFTALAFTSVRAVPPSWLAIVPLVAMALGGLQIGARRRLRVHLAIVFGLVVLILPLFLAGESGIEEERFPIDALPHLEDVPTFHDDRVGGFLVWAEGPDRGVFIDDRAELYGSRIREFVEVRDGEKDWEPVFERDDIQQVLLESDASLLQKLKESGWSTAYQDDDFTILTQPK